MTPEQLADAIKAAEIYGGNDRWRSIVRAQAQRIRELENEVRGHIDAAYLADEKGVKSFRNALAAASELEGAAITDAAVERACAAHWQAKYPNDTRYPNGWPADSLDTDWADERRKWMRASLEAAFSESHQASAE